MVIESFCTFPEAVVPPEQEPGGVNYKQHNVHGIAFRVRKAEETQDGEIEGHAGDEREYQRVPVPSEIMRAPHPRRVERADKAEPERDYG